MPREHGEGGEFVETITLEDVLATFDHVRGPVVLSADVSDRLNCTRETARGKLETLYDQGRLDRRKIARRVIYWPPAESDDTREARERPEKRPVSDTRGDTGSPEPTEERGEGPEENVASAGAGEDLADAVREHLEATDQPPKTAHGRGVILDVFELLRERGAMKTGDLQDEIYPDYTDHWSDGRTMWNAVDRYLEDVPGIEKGGYGEWDYTGDDAVRATLAEAGTSTESGVYDPTEEF